MKTLTKTEYAKRWLISGKKLRQHQAKVHWNMERLASVINRFRARFSDKWIINVGDPGKHANYLMLQRGKYLYALVKGFRFKVEHCNYVLENGHYKDADILLTAENGVKRVKLLVNQDALRSKKIMIDKLNEVLK